MTYQPGQLLEVVPFLPGVPRWLILGGPADSDEAQTAVRLWPGLEILAIEPSPEMRAWQLAHGWPAGPERLLAAALWDVQDVVEFRPAGRRTSAVRPIEGEARDFVGTLTLDYLDSLVGPFRDVLLWLDIEGAEWRALQGARQLFTDGKIIAVNLEVLPEERPADLTAIEKFMAEQGLRCAHRWNSWDQHHDRLYVRRKR